MPCHERDFNVLGLLFTLKAPPFLIVIKFVNTHQHPIFFGTSKWVHKARVFVTRKSFKHSLMQHSRDCFVEQLSVTYVAQKV